MKRFNRLSQGFTLVEIMIAVVIIGFLAAMAIPAFRKVRSDAVRKTVINDARLIANAAQQYFIDKGATTCPTTKIVGSSETNFVKTLSRGNTINVADITADSAFTFQVGNIELGASGLTFDNEGRLTVDPY